MSSSPEQYLALSTLLCKDIKSLSMYCMTKSKSKRAKNARK